jgi:3-hydroxyisobutyrate dehydrogenase-like beta-hydroxyacid dehydrogenase
MSSVGAAEADQLTQAARAHAIRLVDAPVSGSTHPAEEGELTILASGPGSAREAVRPVFDAFASRCSGTVRLPIRPPDTGRNARHQYPTGFCVRLALKDLQLVREIEQSSPATMPLLDAVLERFARASEHLADQDLAPIYEL